MSYHQYVTELTYLLFLKMAKETGQETARGGKANLPEGMRWDDLLVKSAPERLDHYRQALLNLGKAQAPLVRQIYADASSFIRKPTTLSKLVKDIDALDWYSVDKEGLGDLYEGLLAKNANEKKSVAGQYFTPRPLTDAVVTVMKPTSEDTIQDPAAGTGGFLIAAHHYIVTHEDEYTWSPDKQQAYYESAFHGMELVPDTQRLALMNLMLHGLANDPERSGISLGDTLSDDHTKLAPFTRDYFAAFEAAFGPDPYGGPDALAARVDTGEEGRFRRFDHEFIRESKSDSLDISWLKDDGQDQGELPEPSALAEEATVELSAAMEELRAILLELGEDQATLEEAGMLG